ncbi:MAG: ABC-F family ATP-binding cassette domain-containing protein [Eubacterium sp.]|nr:ABC-F family ATP-binding cassette domain-containing protein [Eubacterium sp.]
MILSCQHIEKAFGSAPVLRDVSFNLEENEKAALIGINGAGKSTLLRIITGEMEADNGIVTLSHGKQLGYLAQYQEPEGSETVYSEVRKAKEPVFAMEKRLREIEALMKNADSDEMDALTREYTDLSHQFELENGYAAESEISGVLKGLGFNEDEFDRRMQTLSGGQKMRIVLGRLLLTRPDLLLLDEPTNHLDLNSAAWLESYLSNYRGAVLIVSHDRYFLNRIVGKVIEIENGKTLVFKGNYNDFSRKKSEMRKAEMRAWANQQAEIQHQEAVIRKLKQFNREKSIKRAESREKMLAKTELLEKPQETAADMRITLVPRIESGNDVLTIRGLSKSFPDQLLFADQNIEIKKGERVAIIGSNGTGKTTLLKMINHLVRPDAGTITKGAHVHIGYYDQEHQLLHPEKTIFEEISDDYPTLNQTEIRKTLAAFLFTGDEVFQKIETLSGGERGRVALAKLMLSEANFLILDEPTNHLDIISKEILEDALNSYTGTVLYVSHDRYFINQTCTRILDLANHVFVNYIGNYDYYLEKREEMTRIYADAAPVSDLGTRKTAAGQALKGSAFAGVPGVKRVTSSAQSGSANAALDWKAQKEEQAKIRKRKNDLRKVEEEIDRLEKRNKEIDDEYLKQDVATDPVKCAELAKEQKENNDRLEELYVQWEELSE